MNLAILGSGMIVRDFLSISHEIPGLALRAIFGLESVRPDLDELSATYAIPAVYTDLDACLADPDVDTVYVGLPNSLHAPFAKRALLAGKHVICEKPFTLSVADLAELRAIAQERDLILVEGVTTQYLSNYRAIKESLPQLGELKLVQCEYSQYSSRYPAFREGTVLPAFDPAMGGGALMDIGVYTLHFVAGLLGRPQTISYTANVERGVDTSGVVVLDYGTCTAVLVCAKDSGGLIRTKLQGNDGTILMTSPPNICDDFSITLRGQETQVVDRKVHEHRMVEEFRAFEAMIRTRDLAERDARLDHSELVLELAAAALASAGIRLGPA
ncbi:Gfo/Idh/MocA family protein [Cellulomonas soli]|uniref:NAD(P)-dependent oxidoreductase n=1 Tax=Cellulomonas soli TaxID=931535 RepID=A0A512PD78_9CELL|nr:Gfo/Idh/MocA family oxidoreductase [Cellulomonas soli]NYI60240.1 putative dehydrogenase [Cellulomonas soli]GEP69106.1 NAD(P)-dependent oxidoreductase [Cellulomonas soli]